PRGSAITCKAVMIYGRVEPVACEDLKGHDNFRHGHTHDCVDSYKSVMVSNIVMPATFGRLYGHDYFRQGYDC
ncbi:hypothetical protein HAX54_030625, partial [Datura stramonium]|nr:hypothetical protein [Datura stramonium]